MKKLRVGVIYGGRSGEHEVSLASAAAVIQNLYPERYLPVAILIEKDGRWALPARPPSITVAADVIQGGKPALSEPTRLQILNLLRQGERNVGEIAQACGFTLGDPQWTQTQGPSLPLLSARSAALSAATRAFTASTSAGLVGPWLEPLEPVALLAIGAVAEGRPQK